MTFGTGSIILANIMLAVVCQTANRQNKMTANISGYTVIYNTALMSVSYYH